MTFAILLSIQLLESKSYKQMTSYHLLMNMFQIRMNDNYKVYFKKNKLDYALIIVKKYSPSTHVRKLILINETYEPSKFLS